MLGALVGITLVVSAAVGGVLQHIDNVNPDYTFKGFRIVPVEIAEEHTPEVSVEDLLEYDED